jgi:hypothetical protein
VPLRFLLLGEDHDRGEHRHEEKRRNGDVQADPLAREVGVPARQHERGDEGEGDEGERDEPEPDLPVGRDPQQQHGS